MRLVLTLSALEKAIALVQSAQERGKTVEKLVVSPLEMDSLLNCPIGPDKDDPLGQRSCFKDRELYIMGVPVVVEPVLPAIERTTERAAS